MNANFGPNLPPDAPLVVLSPAPCISSPEPCVDSGILCKKLQTTDRVTKQALSAVTGEENQ